MSKIRGVFGVHSAAALYEKLEADARRVYADPLDGHAAIDFVSSAWHLLEW
ncbi:MAG TPA: hypothetical protein VM198_11195 [Longimicrobiales bacterium]|nr:hypothetical protein [Longimicrobiales bacterium]